MNTLRQFRFISLAIAFSFALMARAGDVQKYEGEITGVVCPACQEHVTEALMKVDGVKSVEIAPTNVPTIRHIVITAAKEGFSAADANNALATAHGETYKVTKLDKKSATH